MEPKNTKRNEKYHFTDVSNQCSVSFGSIITKVRKRHLALFKQNLYEKYTQKFQNCNFLEKPCINILVTYHFGKLIICPIHWFIQNPAHSKIKYYFASPEPWSSMPLLMLIRRISSTMGTWPAAFLLSYS